MDGGNYKLHACERKIRRNLNQDSRSPAKVSNPVPPRHEAGMSAIRPRLSISYFYSFIYRHIYVLESTRAAPVLEHQCRGFLASLFADLRHPSIRGNVKES